MKKKIIAVAMLAMTLVGCENDADVASRNLSTAAANFEVNRRIVFLNGITDKYILVVEGKCAVDTSKTRTLEVTCMTGPKQYKKHHLGLSDNVTYFSEQIEAVNASPYFYRVTFKPSVIVPDITLQ